MLHLFQSIKAFVFDMDGVLTDGSLLLLPDGEMVRKMSVKDGYALQLAVKKGYHVLVISGGYSRSAKERLEKLGISEVHMSVHDKLALLKQYMEQHQLSSTEVLYMGDDIPDLEVMQFAGLPCAPADACAEIIGISRYVSPKGGGQGCVRDVIEKVMKLNKHWTHTVDIQSR